jgi:DNA-binding transcriptional MerR regulator
MRTNDIAESLGISRHTVIDWSKRYGEFLSDDASPPKGTTRAFNLQDLLILRRVNELTKNKNHDEIHDIIESDVADGMFDAASVDPKDFEGPDESAMTLAEARQIIGRYEIALGNEKARADRLERELIEAQKELGGLRGEMGRLQGKIEEMRRQDGRAEDMLKQLSELQRKIGRLEALLEIERERSKKRGESE